jgi:hypothetical protein
LGAIKWNTVYDFREREVKMSFPQFTTAYGADEEGYEDEGNQLSRLI